MEDWRQMPSAFVRLPLSSNCFAAWYICSRPVKRLLHRLATGFDSSQYCWKWQCFFFPHSFLAQDFWVPSPWKSSLNLLQWCHMTNSASLEEISAIKKSARLTPEKSEERKKTLSLCYAADIGINPSWLLIGEESLSWWHFLICITIFEFLGCKNSSQCTSTVPTASVLLESCHPSV